MFYFIEINIMSGHLNRDMALNGASQQKPNKFNIAGFIIKMASVNLKSQIRNFQYSRTHVPFHKSSLMNFPGRHQRF